MTFAMFIRTLIKVYKIILEVFIGINIIEIILQFLKKNINEKIFKMVDWTVLVVHIILGCVITYILIMTDSMSIGVFCVIDIIISIILLRKKYKKQSSNEGIRVSFGVLLTYIIYLVLLMILITPTPNIIA